MSGFIKISPCSEYRFTTTDDVRETIAKFILPSSLIAVSHWRLYYGQQSHHALGSMYIYNVPQYKIPVGFGTELNTKMAERPMEA